jgi:hypothetical protein
MKPTVVTAMILGVCSVTGVTWYPEGQGETIDLKDCPSLDKPFKVAPYVAAAAKLQKLGKEKACKQMAQLAKRGDAGQVAILCRMLFCMKATASFRAPRFGAPIYLGKTSDDDWPLSPIELVDGVPFFIVFSYNLNGQRESSCRYLDFCVENCCWSEAPLGNITDKEIEKALQKLLVSSKWKKPLTDSERKYLISQEK